MWEKERMRFISRIAARKQMVHLLKQQGGPGRGTRLSGKKGGECAKKAIMQAGFTLSGDSVSGKHPSYCIAQNQPYRRQGPRDAPQALLHDAINLQPFFHAVPQFDNGIVDLAPLLRGFPFQYVDGKS
jgi:hypothetical protein